MLQDLLAKTEAPVRGFDIQIGYQSVAAAEFDVEAEGKNGVASELLVPVNEPGMAEGRIAKELVEAGADVLIVNGDVVAGVASVDEGAKEFGVWDGGWNEVEGSRVVGVGHTLKNATKWGEMHGELASRQGAVRLARG